MWYVPVFCFGWLVVKKLRFEKTLVGVVICANENWVVLLFQDSLVLCSVKCKGCTFGTVFVCRLGPRARAPPAGVVSTLWGARARGPKALTPCNETPAHHLPQTDTTSDNAPDTTDKTDTPSHLDSYYPYPVVVFLLSETKVGNSLQIISIRRILLKSGVKEVTYWRYTNMATSGSKQYLLSVYLNWSFAIFSTPIFFLKLSFVRRFRAISCLWKFTTEEKTQKNPRFCTLLPVIRP